MIETLNNQKYDLVIIGGGIAGAGVARDAAMRKLRVALFEKDKFGCGSSSKSSKLIHGGIRYLETAWVALKKGQFKQCWKNIHFVFHELKEGRTLEKIAPDLITPLPMFIPVYDRGTRNPWTVYLGAFLYYLLARFSGQAKLPKIYTRPEKIANLLPGIRTQDLKGGILIWDRLTDDKQLVQKTVFSACDEGADAYEGVSVDRYEYDSEKSEFIIHLKNGEGEATIYSKALVNASGPWIDINRRKSQDHHLDYVLPIAGSHICMPEFIPYSMVLQANDRRIFFVINTGEHARVGTTEWKCYSPDQVKTPDKDIEYLLEALNFYFPEKKFTRQNVVSSDSGIRPLVKSEKKIGWHHVSRDHAIIQSESGVFNTVGVKLTDHRRASKAMVDILIKKYFHGRNDIDPRCKTDQKPL